ncbi:MAG: DNA polymerase III subunit gamma/tau, partial [Xanthomonadales bacterium]|nr:DNA polymerase III subunit gamma/tau [Xanthomonadales bacterium]
MSYLVLARKWRPKRFSELVGQEHVVRALGNALDTGRVHHAFLFTGTRGVGKTTIARIFAKSLNCEQGTSAEPCGQCAACLDIDAGRYIDLLEIDAASNTGVDDVREVIENAQYMPSRGKYKVYLVDEVHMLSKPAFNALLKTLEEPPEHVKFLLATTDPQKLPVTVLSRCLQFNLKRLDEGQIEGQMTRILAAEGIGADAGAIRLLARAADGSLRDGLSLLDQAIAYAGGALGEDAVRGMLGSVDRTQVAALLQGLAGGDGSALLDTVEALAGFAPDWGNVLEALAEALHRIQVRQLVPGAVREDEGGEVDVDGLAARLRPEVVQLWYQMAVNGRRDLELAPAPRIGFEMSLLRMLAFRPEADAGPLPAAGQGAGADAPGRLSLLAEVLVTALLGRAISDRAKTWGIPEEGGRPNRFCVIALGKLGGRELSWGSDCDVIFVCDPGGTCPRNGREGELFWERVAQDLSRTMQEAGLGEVDARLRPWGEQGSLVTTLPSLAEYWKQPREMWERMAHVRAAFLAGDPNLCDEALAILRASALTAARPDDWVAQVASMRGRLEQSVAGEDNLKRGPGGYVDAEFIAQALVLGRPD